MYVYLKELSSQAARRRKEFRFSGLSCINDPSGSKSFSGSACSGVSF